MYDGKTTDEVADDVTGGGGGGWALPPKVSVGVQQLALGAKLYDLAADQAEWSEATFGTDTERGPLGAIRHLRKETVEAEEAWQAVVKAHADGDPHAAMLAERFSEEKADMLLLLLDLNRRSGGTPVDLVMAAHAKMLINRTRVYARTPDGVPSEHVRESDGWITAIGVAAEVGFRAVVGWVGRNQSVVYLIGGLAYLTGVLVWLFNK